MAEHGAPDRYRRQFSDDLGHASELGIGSADWAFSGVVWDAGHALAHLMADFDVGGCRILEVGCGIGLASLVLHKRVADTAADDPTGFNALSPIRPRSPYAG